MVFNNYIPLSIFDNWCFFLIMFVKQFIKWNDDGLVQIDLHVVP